MVKAIPTKQFDADYGAKGSKTGGSESERKAIEGEHPETREEWDDDSRKTADD